MLKERSSRPGCAPVANSPQLSGTYQRGFPGKEAYLRFRFQVVRVWQLSPEPLLTGGLSLMPLALISAVTEAQLPGIINRIEQRLTSRPARRLAPALLGAAYILLGLRYSPALSAQLFQGVVCMKESSTYQAILKEGREEGRTEGKVQGALAEARKVLRLQGDAAFGAPDARTIALIEGLSELDKLEELLKRVRTATSWQELFPPAARGRSKRRASP
jgi:predicted transposase YdaD